MLKKENQSKNTPVVKNKFQQPTINTHSFYAGCGTNITNPNHSLKLTRNELKREVQEYCYELRKSLEENAKNNCSMQGVRIVEEEKRHVQYVPLLMTEYNVKDDRFLEEGQHTKDIHPSGNLKLENLLKKNDARIKTNEDCSNHFNRVVGVIAPAGMGKTCLARQILRLIVDKKLEADYIFYLKFRDIDYKRTTNLLSFLTADQNYEKLDSQILSEIIKIISKNEKTVLVLDGLDESSMTFDSETAIDAHKKAKPQNFILRLLSGDIFPNAKILLTSRPRQLLNMPKKYRPSYIVQITGISKLSQKQICRDICGDEADAIFNHVQNYEKLSYYCSIPLMCNIIMYCLYKIPKAKRNSNLPTTLSEIFVLLILLYVEDKSHSRGNINLKNLCTLAWNGISNRKFFFDDDDMRDAGLENIEQNDFTMTIKCENSENILSFLTHDLTEFTYFSHLAIEEFFAAMHIVFFEKDLKELKNLFSRDHDLNLHETNYDLFSLFIFGLCNETIISQYFKQNFNVDLYKQKVMMTKQFLQNIQPTYTGSFGLEDNDNYPSLTESSLKTMDWLYQLKDVGLTGQFADSLDNHIGIRIREIRPNYILPFNYILRHRSKEIMFDIVTRCDWLYGGLERFMEEFGRTLDENHNVKLRWLWIHTKLTVWNVSSLAICLRKVEGRIVVCRGFASLKAARKFKNFVMERETPLEYLSFRHVKWYNFRIRSPLGRCQEKVKHRIDYDTFSFPIWTYHLFSCTARRRSYISI